MLGPVGDPSIAEIWAWAGLEEFIVGERERMLDNWYLVSDQ